MLAVAFLGVHIATSVVDGFAPIGWVSVVVPFTSPYRPLWLGLGALALDLVIALTLTSLIRQRLGHTAWRAIHWSAYACWPIAFVHGLGTGSDGRVGWVQVVDLACLAAIVIALGWRMAAGWVEVPGRRLAGTISAALAVVLILGWAATGPTQRGWAKKAGTPASLLGSSRAGAKAAGAPASGFTLPLASPIDGSLSQQGTSQDVVVTIDASLTGADSGSVRVVLEGQALADGGLQLRHGTVSVGPRGRPTLYSGPVSALSTEPRSSLGSPTQPGTPPRSTCNCRSTPRPNT